MIGEAMFDQGHFHLLKRALSTYALRHRVVADNIVNQRTEGFLAQKVDFENLLQQNSTSLALKRNRPQTVR